MKAEEKNTEKDREVASLKSQLIQAKVEAMQYKRLLDGYLATEADQLREQLASNV